MLFIGFAILIAVALALLISADAGSLVGLTEQQTGQLLPLVIILIILAGGLFARRYRFSQLLGDLALWVGIFGVVLVGYTFRDDLSSVASRVFGELMPGAAVIDVEGGTAKFRSGRDGHFQINATINGAEIRTIFDTGASAIVLTLADARKAGINISKLSFTVPVSTANGTGYAATVLLDRVDVGSIVRRRVRAFVAEAAALETSLLGMSFLGTLSRYAVTANSLELID